MNEGDKIVFTMPDGKRVETTVCFVSGAYREELATRARHKGCLALHEEALRRRVEIENAKRSKGRAK